jgi:hypothetical protein
LVRPRVQVRRHHWRGQVRVHLLRCSPVSAHADMSLTLWQWCARQRYNSSSGCHLVAFGVDSSSSAVEVLVARRHRHHHQISVIIPFICSVCYCILQISWQIIITCLGQEVCYHSSQVGTCSWVDEADLKSRLLLPREDGVLVP